VQGVSLTSGDAPGIPPDLRMRSRQFSTLPDGSRAHVPPMCPLGVVSLLAGFCHPRNSVPCGTPLLCRLTCCSSLTVSHQFGRSSVVWRNRDRTGEPIDAFGMPSDLLLRSWQFSACPGQVSH
jgi:hypothetical protein